MVPKYRPTSLRMASVSRSASRARLVAGERCAHAREQRRSAEQEEQGERYDRQLSMKELVKAIAVLSPATGVTIAGLPRDHGRRPG